MRTASSRTAISVRCRPCGYVWIAVLIPMQLDRLARALGRATCPCCGEIGDGLAMVADDGGALASPIDPATEPGEAA